MEYTWLGSSGVKVSNLCLGTMTFGEDTRGRPGSDKETSLAILDRFVKFGGNFIDTADMYTYGGSEEIIGEWLANQNRRKIILATKCGRCMDPSDPNAVGGSRLNIMNCIDDSLRRLQTDYIDLFYFHVWDYGAPIEETLSALNDLVTMGKVRYIGLSNFKGWQLQKAIDISKHRGWQPITALQAQYNLLNRSTELEVAEVCKQEGVALLPWSPLKGGWLSGKVTEESQPAAEGTRMAWASSGKGLAHHSHPDRNWFGENKQVWDVLKSTEGIAKKLGRTVPQVAVRWLLQKEVVSSVVIGGRTLAHVEDNLVASSGLTLSEEQMKELDDVSEIQWPYPYDYIRRLNPTRLH